MIMMTAWLQRNGFPAVSRQTVDRAMVLWRRDHAVPGAVWVPAWSAQRREHVEQLLKDEGIVVQPPLAAADRDDWPVLSMPQLSTRHQQEVPDPQPPEAWSVGDENVEFA